MYRVENPSGRLVTLRLASPLSDEESLRVVADIRRVLGAVPGRGIICTELTGAKTFSQPVAERFTALMRSDNPKIERSAFLIAKEAATFALQIERMIREAGNPSRRTFREAAQMEAWVGELLTADEQIALHAFLERTNG
jgi:hypothetical protein